MTLPDKPTLDSLHLEDLLPFVDNRDRMEFVKNAGQQHFRLFAWLSQQYNNANIFDIGTFRGSSAVALSYNPKNTIYSFNVQNERQCDKTPFNVAFLIENLLERNEYYIGKLKKSPLVVVDVHDVKTGEHNGALEWDFYMLLKEIGYTGIAVFDDVRLNDKMKTFWSSVSEHKEDVTYLGHGDWNAGTGIIDFGKKLSVKFGDVASLPTEVDANGRPKNWVD